jgi:hypothetical protein
MLPRGSTRRTPPRRHCDRHHVPHHASRTSASRKSGPGSRPRRVARRSRFRPISGVRLPGSARSLSLPRRLASGDRVGDDSLVATQRPVSSGNSCAGRGHRRPCQASRPQHVGQPRQATAVTARSTSETGPTKATSPIASTAATTPAAPLNRCARSEPLASGERRLLSTPWVITRVVVISPFVTPRRRARIIRSASSRQEGS